jgi:hypothetical protein
VIGALRRVWESSSGNGLAVLNHSLQAEFGRFFNVFEPFLIGVAPRMTIRQGWDFGIVPIFIRLNHHTKDRGFMSSPLMWIARLLIIGQHTIAMGVVKSGEG